MSRIIQDDLLKKSIIVVKGRENRPFVDAKEEKECPFCENNKLMIEKLHIEEAKYGIRIVNNKYPICDDQGELYGSHDVVIDTRHHNMKPWQFEVDHWEVLLTIIKKRCQQIFEDEKIQLIQIFKNFGEKGGASISHSHWQIVGLSQQLESIACSMNDLKKAPLDCMPKEQLIIRSEDWHVGFPKNPLMRDEIWIAPTKRVSQYDELSESQIKDLANVFSKLLRGYEKYLPDVNYNICFSQNLREANNKGHFIIRFIPREENIAGFELATNCFIVTREATECTTEIRQHIENLE